MLSTFFRWHDTSEKAKDGGYGIYIPELAGIGVIGDTEEKAKINLLEVINDIVEQCKIDGVKDNVYGIYISENRKKQIENGIHKLAYNMLNVRFWLACKDIIKLYVLKFSKN